MTATQGSIRWNVQNFMGVPLSPAVIALKRPHFYFQLVSKSPQLQARIFFLSLTFFCSSENAPTADKIDYLVLALMACPGLCHLGATTATADWRKLSIDYN